MFMGAAGELCGHECGRPMTHIATKIICSLSTLNHISSKRETARRRNQKLSSTFWVVNQTQTSSSITAFALNQLNQVWLKIYFVYLNCCKCSDWTLWKGYPQIRQTEAWGTHTPTHGLASTSHMRAAISPRQWQSATQPFLVSSRNAPPHIFCFNSYRVYRSSTT